MKALTRTFSWFTYLSVLAVVTAAVLLPSFLPAIGARGLWFTLLGMWVLAFIAACFSLATSKRSRSPAKWIVNTLALTLIWFLVSVTLVQQFEVAFPPAVIE